MTPVEFDALPTEAIAVDRCVYQQRGMDSDHMAPTAPAGVEYATGPIHVEQLIDGTFYVHNGRHRTWRAWQRGQHTIEAKVLRHRAVMSRVSWELSDEAVDNLRQILAQLPSERREWTEAERAKWERREEALDAQASGRYLSPRRLSNDR